MLRLPMVATIVILTILGANSVDSIGGVYAKSAPDTYEEVHENWERFGAVYGRILEYYYRDLDHTEVMRAAIEGMLHQLDAYSQYYDEDGLRQLRQDTSGKYAGLGITIALRNHYPVVISPIEGSPADRAGLVPGDMIVAIEGRETVNMSLEEIVNVLRGDVGSGVRIRVGRGKSTREVDIVREIITIKSVALTTLIEPGVGYISMRQTRFTEESATEVEEATKNIRASGAKGLILDLRGNPGGLLSQATKVADLFLTVDAPIVSIRERNGRHEEMRFSQRSPVAGQMPLIVLIDEGSASAAEIVAGAIQDNDRGVILGSTSFGKGSVQTVFELEALSESALKLTTAHYYTPSGRSIHREGHNRSGHLFSDVSFSGMVLPAGVVLDEILNAGNQARAMTGLQMRLGLKEAEAELVLSTPIGRLTKDKSVQNVPTAEFEERSFYTRANREVFGGGGISPDIEVESGQIPAFVQELFHESLVFDFVGDYLASDNSGVEDVASAEVDSSMISEFGRFLATRQVEQPGAREVKGLRRLADELGWGDEVNRAIDALEIVLASARLRQVEEFHPRISAAIRRELILRRLGRKASLLTELKDDPVVGAAVELLHDTRRYGQLLNGPSSS